MTVTPPTPDWTLVPIFGRWRDFRSQPIANERIIVTPSALRATDVDQLTTIVGRPFVVLTDENGEIHDHWPATDDPDITPIEFTYHIKEDFDGGSEYDIAVPMALADVGGVKLPTATAVPPDPGTAVDVSAMVIAVPAGTTGWENLPDGTLWVEYI